MTPTPAHPSPRHAAEALRLEKALPRGARHRGEEGFVEPYRHRSYAASLDRDKRRTMR